LLIGGVTRYSESGGKRDTTPPQTMRTCDGIPPGAPKHLLPASYLSFTRLWIILDDSRREIKMQHETECSPAMFVYTPFADTKI